MNYFWRTLSIVSLAIIALLFLKLKTSEQENHQLSEKQTALVGQIAAMNGKLGKSASVDGKPGDKLVTEAATVHKVEPSAELASWQRKYAPIRHTNLLRIVWIRYHEAIAKLNLPRTEQMQLLNLLLARDEGGYDAADAARSAGISDPQEIKQAVAAAKNSVSGEIATLIGSSGLESVDNSVALKSQETGIELNVGAQLAMDGIPLTPDQEAGLAQIYADVYKQNPTSSGHDFYDAASQIIEHQADTEASVLNKASAFLTPEQVADLKNYIGWSSQRSKLTAEMPK
jgi:hypothetical protein